MPRVVAELTEIYGTETVWGALFPMAAAIAGLAFVARVPFGWVASHLLSQGMRAGTYDDAQDLLASAWELMRGRTGKGPVARLAWASLAVVLVPLRLGLHVLLLGAWVGVPVAFIVWQLASNSFVAMLPVWIWLSGEAGWAGWSRLQLASSH